MLNVALVVGPPGIAIGGDVFPGSTLSDHCCRYQNIDAVKLIVVLGELGGHDEYSLVRRPPPPPLLRAGVVYRSTRVCSSRTPGDAAGSACAASAVINSGRRYSPLISPLPRVASAACCIKEVCLQYLRTCRPSSCCSHRWALRRPPGDPSAAGLGQVEALKAKTITKPVVAWVSGTCATLFKSEVQFGHAGARSGGAQESAQVPPPLTCLHFPHISPPKPPARSSASTSLLSEEHARRDGAWGRVRRFCLRYAHLRF